MILQEHILANMSEGWNVDSIRKSHLLHQFTTDDLNEMDWSDGERKEDGEEHKSDVPYGTFSIPEGRGSI
jgi:hypothetical protein